MRKKNLVHTSCCPEGYAATNVSAKLAQHGHGTEQAQCSDPPIKILWTDVLDLRAYQLSYW